MKTGLSRDYKATIVYAGVLLQEQHKLSHITAGEANRESKRKEGHLMSAGLNLVILIIL